jgi:predicted AlkP superfamily phosphohydrolase/phosphomutase
MIIGYIDPGTGYVLGGGLTGLLVAACSFFLIFLKKIWFFLKKPPAFITIILIILGLGIYLFVKDKKEESAEKYNHKIIILGFDGLSPKITERLMLEGKLPNFLKLKQMGDYQHLATTNPPQSPVAWSSFATGKNPGKHGVFDFILRDPKDYSISLSLSHLQKDKPKTVLQAKGFWWYTSQKKVPTIVLGCPLTFPPEKIYGRMLSGMGVPDIRGTEGTFSFYTTERIAKLAMGNVFWVNKGSTIVSYFLGPKYLSFMGTVMKARVPFKVQLHQARESVTIEYQNKKVELKKGQWSNWQGITFDTGLFKKVDGIFKIYLVEVKPEFKLYVSPINFDPRNPLFPISSPPEYSKEIAKNNGLFYTQGMSDIIQHMFWRYIDPGHPMYDANGAVKYKGVIDQWYERMDEVLGDALKHMGKEDTVMVLSDHGFDTFRRAVHINSWLRDNDYLVLKDPPATRGIPLFANVDWSKTKAYALGFGGIYNNQKGREREGIVNPGEESQRIKTEIIQKMKGWTDDQNNTPVIHRIYRNEEIFWGDYANKAPDLFIGFNIGYEASWQTALGGAPSESIEDNLKKWSGSHLFDPSLVPGILLSNKKIIKKDPCLYDLTPTILKLIGHTDEEIKDFDFDGRPLFSLF